MADNEDFRIEARLSRGKGGADASADYIETLRQRQMTHAHATRKKPQKSFAQVMAVAPEDDVPAEAPTPRAVVPTPRPGLRRPADRDTFAVATKVRVVLKG